MPAALLAGRLQLGRGPRAYLRIANPQVSELRCGARRSESRRYSQREGIGSIPIGGSTSVLYLRKLERNQGSRRQQGQSPNEVPTNPLAQ